MTSHSNVDPDGPEDVNNFLTRIRELGEKRDQEDLDRTKKLEDEIIQGRKERQARRAGKFPRCFPLSLSPARVGVAVIVYYQPLRHYHSRVRTRDNGLKNYYRKEFGRLI